MSATFTKDDLWATGASWHYAYMVDGHLDHVGGFAECPARVCADLRAALAAHAFAAEAPPFTCERCGETYPSVDDALQVGCAT